MCAQRRVCKLVNADYKDVDLTQYSKIIIDTINKTVPNKNPIVTKTGFSTDLLTHREAVLIGKSLASLDELEGYGKQVTIFRLFDGKVIDTDKINNVVKKPKVKRRPIKASNTPKGGRIR